MDFGILLCLFELSYESKMVMGVTCVLAAVVAWGMEAHTIELRT